MIIPLHFHEYPMKSSLLAHLQSVYNHLKSHQKPASLKPPKRSSDLHIPSLIITCCFFGLFSSPSIHPPTNGTLRHLLVGGIPTPLKNMSSSVGMMNFPIYGKRKCMFQTTDHLLLSVTKTIEWDPWVLFKTNPYKDSHWR